MIFIKNPFLLLWIVTTVAFLLYWYSMRKRNQFFASIENDVEEKGEGYYKVERLYDGERQNYRIVSVEPPNIEKFEKV